MSLKPEQALIMIGFDKNGECDFSNSCAIGDLTPARMNELRQMIPVAIASAENLWRQFGPPSREQACAAEPYRPAVSGGMSENGIG